MESTYVSLVKVKVTIMRSVLLFYYCYGRILLI